MSLREYFDTDATSVVGWVLIALGLFAVIETLLQITIIGGKLPFLEGWIAGLVTIAFGFLLWWRGATRAAEFVKEIFLGLFRGG